MIIKVSKGYVSYKGELYGVGKTIELPDDTAKSLIVQGVVEEAGELPASDIEPVLDDEETSELEELEDEDAEEEDEDIVAELPAVEPEQTVSKSTGKANSKGTSKTNSKGKGGNTRAKKV
ncbi:MAG: hypothetical protein K6C05_07365 [Anaerovibrio sp.]|uniref:hypothetical protein n=1 Tax=Anaerovibrio sp. TaxID=1872532 RepID=UPI0025E0DBD7|nr:hypothetical protein [Anaerovibrio sp.]MCR5176657.1 hypothetical protein [Anaerovibrio sp.]